MLPNLDNTLYYYDEDARAWRSRRAGVAVATDSQRVQGRLPLPLPGRTTTTCYVLVHLHTCAALLPSIRLQVSLEPTTVAREADAFFQLAWVMSLAVVTLLLVTNLLTYSRPPGRITFYYACTQWRHCSASRHFGGTLKCCGPARLSASWCGPAA